MITSKLGETSRTSSLPMVVTPGLGHSPVSKRPGVLHASDALKVPSPVASLNV